MTWLWGFAAAAALLWPGRAAGPFDGLPLELGGKAILLGVLFPLLWWWQPAFLRTRTARALVLALLASKAIAAATLAPEGWCVRFEPGRPLVRDATSPVPHSWDVRADWLDPAPACSAVMRRPYTGIGEFPVWFFNLPPPNDSWPAESDRPPGARTQMTVTGFLDAPRAAELRLAVGDDVLATTTAYVDGVPFRDAVSVPAGVHRIRVDSLLTGERWQFVPSWDGAPLWTSSATATTTRPRTGDRILRTIDRALVTLLVLALLATWSGSFIGHVGSPAALAWMVAASAALTALTAAGLTGAACGSVVALAGAALLPIPERLRNLTGAFVLVGVPWLALVVTAGAGDIGRFWFYGVGHDYWTYQRFAYRIVMQGYWLEGGSKTFYFQPLYRWIVGLLHLVFGDSSVGERYWDGACVLVTALFSWRIADAFAGFRAGLLAAALTLSVFALGTPWPLIGRGLGEMSSAGLLSLAAFVAMDSRRRPLRVASLAGALAVLAFYTRLNNLPMAIGVAVFALSPRVSIQRAARIWSPPRIAWRTAIVVVAVIAIGAGLFTLRTWHYTGVFGFFYGTQRGVAAVSVWQPGMSAITALGRAIESVMMVLTVNDPPRFDWRALPVLAGAAAASLALLGVPRFRTLPAAPILFLISGLAGSFVMRGFTYAGRFSVHIVGVASALAVCAAVACMRTPNRPASDAARRC